MANLNSLSKLNLVAVGRRLGIGIGDYCRLSKGEIVAMVASHENADELEAAVQDVIGVSVASGVAALPQSLVAVPNSRQAAAAPLEIAAPIFTPEVVGTKTLKELFDIRSKRLKDKTMEIWNDPDAPDIDPDYIFDKDKLEEVVACISTGTNFWLYGPAGTGKTEFVKNLAAKLGRAFYRVSFDASLERYEFLGGERAKLGSTVWQDGVILMAMQRPGAIILLDEVGFARSEYLSALHAPLEPNAVLTITETGRKVRKAPGVLFCAADNSNGTGDATGLYVGVGQKNRAFTSRFGAFIEIKYMAPETEREVLVKRTGCTEDVAKIIVGFLGICRQQAISSVIEEAPSLREAFALAKFWMAGLDVRRAFTMAMANRLSEENTEQLQQLYRANIDEDSVEAAVDGKLDEFVAAKNGTAPAVPVGADPVPA